MRTLRRAVLAGAAVLAILPTITAAIEVRRVTLPTRHLVADPVRQKLYASVPGTSLTYGNHVVRIDPETGHVDTAVFVGSEPGALAIDADATVLYVGIDGTGRVVRVNLDSFAVELDFPLGSVSGAFLAESIAVMPGNPDSVAVDRGRYQYSYDAGVAIYDHGVRRPNVAFDSFNGIRSIAFSDNPAKLYAASDYRSGLYSLAVGPAGVTIGDFWELPQQSSGVQIEYAGGTVYTSDGFALLPDSQTLAGRFSGVSSGILEPDVASNRVYFLVQDQLDAFDRTTFARASTRMVPGVSDLYYTRTDLVRFGDDGLAFRTETELVLLRLSRSNDDPCDGVPRCDPVTGQCTRQPAFDFAPCDDGDACTTGETCQGGECRSDSRVDCNDNDPCTVDACDATTGCTHTVVAGSCWGIAGRASASACAPQGCQTQRTTVSGVLLLGDDATYTIPTTRICDATQRRFPDERGTVAAGRNGWLTLRPGNVAERIAALKACPSIAKLARQIEIQTLRHSRQRIMIPTTGGSFCRWSPALADGSHLCGIQRSGGSLVVRGVRVGFSIVARFGGERLDGGRVE